MRIGLYGMPTAGKTYVLDKIDFIDVVVGSKLLREYDPDFDLRDEAGRAQDRKDVANIMKQRDHFIMDGHYAFGDEIAFTEDEGEMYDIYLYLYIDPTIIENRMSNSDKNKNFLKYDISEWQKKEIEGLREYCHKHCKDFYVIDNPPRNDSEDVESIVSFIRDIVNGFSCSKYAEHCAKEILRQCDSDYITLVDGDKTLSRIDTSKHFMDYKTHLFDGNYYTGYQTWKHSKELANYRLKDFTPEEIEYNEFVLENTNECTFIVTAGCAQIWDRIANHLGLSSFGGSQMSAETKLYIAKFLHAAGKKVFAFGDGMNDYFMLKEADEGYLITKPDGSISRSLKGKNVEGIRIV